jgi:hypothetical protein
MERLYAHPVHWFSCNVPLFLSDFNNNFIFSTYFRKNSNIEFHENMFSGRTVYVWGRADGQMDIET